MRFLKVLFLLISISFFVVSCGSSGGGSDGGGGSPAGTNPPTTGTINSYSSTTASDGKASFTLSDGSTDTVKVMDERTGNPISGISVILITDGTDIAYFFIDPNREYAPVIVNTSNLSVTNNSSANEISPQYVGIIREAYLTFMSRVVRQDDPTPLTADRIPPGLSQYIIDNYYQHVRTTTVGDLFDKVWDVYVTIGETVVTAIVTSGASLLDPLGWTVTGMEVAISANSYYWEDYYNSLGYSDNAEVDIYEYIGGNGAPAVPYSRIVIPKDPMPAAFPYSTSVSGKIVDSTTGQGLAGVDLTIYPLGYKAVTDSSGNYTFYNFSVYSSFISYSITATKVGYDRNELTNIQITLGTNNPNNNISLNPIVSSTQQYRIVLEWGANPSDLDSHLWTPSIGGTSYHIYYVTRSDYDDLNSPPYADLDVDDTSSYGPETITIGSLQPGTYSYAVYHYAGSGTITTSGATVKVYDSIGLLQSFSVPTTTSGSNYWWTVFTIDGATGQITPVDTIGSSSPQAFSQSVSLSASGVK